MKNTMCNNHVIMLILRAWANIKCNFLKIYMFGIYLLCVLCTHRVTLKTCCGSYLEKLYGLDFKLRVLKNSISFLPEIEF